MKHELMYHKLAYTILAIGLAVGVIIFLAVWPDRFAQRVTAVWLALFYFFWGLVTHLHHQQITRSVIFEYLGVASLAGLILVLVTL